MVAALAAATAGPARARLGKAIVAFQFEEGLEAIEDLPELDTVRTALQQLRAAHGQERQVIADANDWSGIAD